MKFRIYLRSVIAKMIKLFFDEPSFILQRLTGPQSTRDPLIVELGSLRPVLIDPHNV